MAVAAPEAAPATAQPWLAAQQRALMAQRGHAWLLQGPSGLGQYELALGLVAAWLCDHPTPDGACGQCGSCHAVRVHTHADLCVLMPETSLTDKGWPLDEKSQQDIDEKKRKPSREIRVEAMRDAVQFAQRTSARGRGKAVLVYPAERMNHVTANTLLKTLEEPPGDVRFVLASESAHQLLPTIRSRCIGYTMAWPPEREALDWLKEQGVAPADAPVLLRAAGQRPADALRFWQAGRNARAWQVLPKAVARGEVAALADLTPSQAIDALHKLSHDLLAVQAGAAPRFFDAGDLPAPGSPHAMSAWAKALAQAARTAEHPFNAGLMLESLVSEARTALNSQSRP